MEKNKWKIEIVLNSGKELTGYYYGTEENSDTVAHKLLSGDKNSFFGIRGKEAASNLLVKIGEFAAIVVAVI